MIIYKYIKANTFNVTIDAKQFTINGRAVKVLKDANFSIEHWNIFLILLQEKDLKLIQIIQKLFPNAIASNYELKILSLCIFASNFDNNLLIEYFNYHANICFKETWLHYLSLAHYHGFKDSKNAPMHSILSQPYKSKSYKAFTVPFKEIVNQNIHNNNLELKICPDFKNRQYLKLFAHGKWHQVTLDIKKSYKLQKSVSLTKQLLDDIKISLHNNISLQTIINKYDVNEGVVVSYAFAIYEDLIIKIIKSNLRKQLHSNQQISLFDALKFHIKQINHRLKRLKRDMPLLYIKLQNIAISFQSKQIRHYMIYNKNILIKNLTCYNIGFIQKNTWYSLSFNFNSIKDDNIAIEIKSYIYQLLLKNSRLNGINKIINLSVFVKKNYNHNNLSANKFLLNQIVLWLINLDITANTKKATKNHISSFINFLISAEVVQYKTIYKLPKAPVKNEIKDIKIDSHNEHFTEPLPEDIYIQIRSHINELSPYVRNAFLIISATGCRPSELATITQDSMKFDSNRNVHFLTIKIGKQSKAYSKKGKLAIRKIPIYDQDVLDAFSNQVKISETARDTFNSKLIFIRQTNAKKFQDKHYITSSKDLLREVNRIISKYQISSDLEKEQWRYTPYQMRAMLATVMVERGHATEEIRAFFGWMSKHTSERAYAYVRNKKMLELNNNFFEKHFNIAFNKDALKQYTKKEKEELFVELYIHYRVMEYGKCVRHPIMGECGKLQTAESCASCARLITSPEYIPYWEKLHNNQKDILEAIVKKLEDEGVNKEIYTEWAEYKIEHNRLFTYENLLNKLKKGLLS